MAHSIQEIEEVLTSRILEAGNLSGWKKHNPCLLKEYDCFCVFISHQTLLACLCLHNFSVCSRQTVEHKTLCRLPDKKSLTCKKKESLELSAKKKLGHLNQKSKTGGQFIRKPNKLSKKFLKEIHSCTKNSEKSGS